MPKIIYLFLLILFVVLSCSKVDQEFEKALETNTIQAYKLFIQKYPDSEYSNQAEDKMILLTWEKISEQNTIQSYQSFIKQFPSSEYCNNAEKKIISLSWEKALQENTEESYELFINQYPDSEFKDLALNNLYDLYWEKLRKGDDVVEYLLVLMKDKFNCNLTYSMSLRNKIINRLQDIYFSSIERERIGLLSIFGGYGNKGLKELKFYDSKLQKAKNLISSTNTSDIIQGIGIYRSTSLEVTMIMRERAYGINY